MKKYTLQYPFKSKAGYEIKEVTIRRPKVRDIRKGARSGLSKEEQGINLLGDLCQLAPDDVDDLDPADFLKIQEFFEDFLPEELRPPKQSTVQ